MSSTTDRFSEAHVDRRVLYSLSEYLASTSRMADQSEELRRLLNTNRYPLIEVDELLPSNCLVHGDESLQNAPFKSAKGVRANAYVGVLHIGEGNADNEGAASKIVVEVQFLRETTSEDCEEKSTSTLTDDCPVVVRPSTPSRRLPPSP